MMTSGSEGGPAGAVLPFGPPLLVLAPDLAAADAGAAMTSVYVVGAL